MNFKVKHSYTNIIPLGYDQPVYQVGKMFFPRVTTILDEVIAKPQLLYWYGNLGIDKAEEQSKMARERGTRVHQAAEHLLNGGVIDLNTLSPAGVVTRGK